MFHAIDAFSTATPSLMLRVSLPLRRHQDLLIQEGLTIGSDPSCRIHLDEPGVRGLHATVTEDDRGLKFRCSFGASMMTPDGTPFDELRIVPGLTFFIADATCRCLHPGELDEKRDPPAAAPSAQDLVSRPQRSPCPRCREHLGTRAAAARFCPRCGFDLLPPLDGAEPQLRPDADLTGPIIESEMLTGYANALHRLGRMYEHGYGLLKNDREALRCFHKSAQLGNDEARRKLDERGLSLGAEPSALPVDAQREI